MAGTDQLSFNFNYEVAHVACPTIKSNQDRPSYELKSYTLNSNLISEFSSLYLK